MKVRGPIFPARTVSRKCDHHKHLVYYKKDLNVLWPWILTFLNEVYTNENNYFIVLMMFFLQVYFSHLYFNIKGGLGHLNKRKCLWYVAKAMKL